MNEAKRDRVRCVWLAGVLLLVASGCGDDDTGEVLDTSVAEDVGSDALLDTEPEDSGRDVMSADTGGSDANMDAFIVDASDDAADASEDVAPLPPNTMCETAPEFPFDERVDIDFRRAVSVDACNDTDEEPSLFYTVSVPPGHSLDSLGGGRLSTRLTCGDCDSALPRGWSNASPEAVDVVLSMRQSSDPMTFRIVRSAGPLPNDTCESAEDLTSIESVSNVSTFVSGSAHYFVDVPPSRTLEVTIRKSIRVSGGVPFATLYTSCGRETELGRTSFTDPFRYTNEAGETERVFIVAVEDGGVSFNLRAALVE